jgi:hypothetical protein
LNGLALMKRLSAQSIQAIRPDQIDGRGTLLTGRGRPAPPPGGQFLPDPMQKQIRGIPLAGERGRKDIEALVTHAYLQLVRVAWDENRSRSAVLARYGRYEVRLIEFLPVANQDLPFLWIELYDMADHTCVDSVGCDDLDAAMFAAERTIAQAQALSEGRGSPGR